MLMKYKDFKMMSQNEMKKILGGSEEEGEDNGGTISCSTVCYNCAALAVKKCGPSCIGNAYGITCANGSLHPCPSGNYCS
jgi:hypothetical protein